MRLDMTGLVARVGLEGSLNDSGRSCRKRSGRRKFCDTRSVINAVLPISYLRDSWGFY